MTEWELNERIKYQNKSKLEKIDRISESAQKPARKETTANWIECKLLNIVRLMRVQYANNSVLHIIRSIGKFK